MEPTADQLPPTLAGYAYLLHPPNAILYHNATPLPLLLANEATLLSPFQLTTTLTLYLASHYASTNPVERADELNALHNALSILHGHTHAPLIIAGDFNSTLLPIDSANGLPGDKSTAARTADDKERKLLLKHHLRDEWRLSNPDTKLYSHFHTHQHPRRLDRIYSRNVVPVISYHHLPHLSDHSLLTASFNTYSLRAGKTRWKYATPRQVYLPAELIVGSPDACSNPHATILDAITEIQAQCPPPRPDYDTPSGMYKLLLQRAHQITPKDILRTLQRIQQHTSVQLAPPSDTPHPHVYLHRTATATTLALRIEELHLRPPAPTRPLDSACNLNAFMKAIKPSTGQYSIPQNDVHRTASAVQADYQARFTAPASLWACDPPPPLLTEHLRQQRLSPPQRLGTCTLTTPSEIEQIIMDASWNSAPGPDGLSYGAFQHPDALLTLTNYINYLSTTGSLVPPN